jgi:hypothetical protein
LGFSIFLFQVVPVLVGLPALRGELRDNADILVLDGIFDKWAWPNGQIAAVFQ